MNKKQNNTKKTLVLKKDTLVNLTPQAANLIRGGEGDTKPKTPETKDPWFSILCHTAYCM